MRAVVLAAGKGSRLGELTRSIPKPMITIKGKPVLEHNIKWLKQNGIKEIYINLHYLPEVIEEYFSDGKAFGVNIHYSFETEILGTAGGVKKIADTYWQNSLDTFLILYGDNLYNYNITELIEFHKKDDGIATIGLYEIKDVSQSGIVVLNDKNRIIKFIEKPISEERVSNLVNIGLYIVNPKILSYIPSDTFSDFGKDIFPKLIANNEKVFGIKLMGNLRPIDTKEMLQTVLKDEI